VSGIVQTGGTFLGTARAPAFTSAGGRGHAVDVLRRERIDGVIVIGGNGSQAGTLALARAGVPAVGVASTIDNDLPGTEVSIGVDTALNIALEAIDRLKVTAAAHDRAFLVEVMGRRCGYLALMAGIAGGAEAVVLPEAELAPAEVAEEIRRVKQKGKRHALVVVAEGARHDARTLACYFEENREKLGLEFRVTALGHVQRGGTPSAFDRVLATRLGAAAVDAVGRSSRGLLVGLLAGQVATTPLDEVVGRERPLDRTLLALAGVLAG
jgi:6-phosphofructokinase 1